MTETITIEPDTAYTKESLAKTFGVTTRFIELQLKRRRGSFPRPYYVGRTPLWQGRVVLNWMRQQQREACPE